MNDEFDGELCGEIFRSLVEGDETTAKEGIKLLYDSEMFPLSKVASRFKQLITEEVTRRDNG